MPFRVEKRSRKRTFLASPTCLQDYSCKGVAPTIKIKKTLVGKTVKRYHLEEIYSLHTLRFVYRLGSAALRMLALLRRKPTFFRGESGLSPRQPTNQPTNLRMTYNDMVKSNRLYMREIFSVNPLCMCPVSYTHLTLPTRRTV